MRWLSFGPGSLPLHVRSNSGEAACHPPGLHVVCETCRFVFAGSHEINPDPVLPISSPDRPGDHPASERCEPVPDSKQVNVPPVPAETAPSVAESEEGPLSSLSVFFPAQNEAGNIERVVRSALEICAPLTGVLEVIVVDDGSTDETPEIVAVLGQSDPRVRLVRHEVNRGYGGALKSGLAAATGDYIFYTDGDGQFDIHEIVALVPLLKQADLIAGYRIHRSDPWYRLVNARLYHWLIHALFGLKMKDVDCAFKLIKRAVVDSLKLTSEGALISAEFLLRAQRSGFRIVEVGVHHYPRQWGKASGARLSVILRMFVELFRFKQTLARESKDV